MIAQRKLRRKAQRQEDRQGDLSREKSASRSRIEGRARSSRDDGTGRRRVCRRIRVMRRFTAVAVIATLVCELSSLCGAPEKRIDLAAIVSKKDAESTLGEAVKDPQSQNEE